MSQPLHKVGNRTDFTFNGQPMVGTITAVHKLAAVGPLPARYNYSIRSNGQSYYVFEENVSTPYGPNDD
jgi:hypothetical protein